VGLGANGIFNAAILLRSDVRAPALGRYLHEQAHQDVLVDTATIRGFFGGTSETGHGYHFYHGIDRSSAGAVLLETVNAPASIRREPGRWANRIHFRLIAEDLPRAENRVTLEDDEPVIDWVGHDDYAYRGLARARNGLPGIIPDAIDRIEPGLYHASEAHIQGTHRMGRAPETSVTDDRMRVHGVPNLYVLGAGAFPACSPANPTLTIAALSLRASETVG
jgi:choline dehydrogenase-like flavoprotein